MLEELEERSSELIKKVEEYKERRNDLNAEASKWADLRDELNKRIMEAVEKANNFRRLNREYNRRAAESKLKRDELNKKASTYYSMVEKLRKKNDMYSIQSFERLRGRIDDLEFKQQVKVLSMGEERQLVARIAVLKKEFHKMEKDLEKDKRLKELLIKAQRYRREADKYHEEVVSCVKQAQESHDKVKGWFKEADRLREKADEAHRFFRNAKEEADEAHRLFVKHLRDKRDVDQVINGLRRKIYEDRGFRERMEAQEKMKDIYERFREGEKLSTTDLLLFQRFKKA